MAGNFCLLHFPETGYTERPKMRRDTVLSPMICSLRQRISGRKHSFPASHFSFYMPEYFEFANYTSLTVLIFECILRQHRTMGTAGFGGSFAPIVQYEKWEIHPVFPHFPYFRLCQNLSPNLLAPLCGAALTFWRALFYGQRLGASRRGRAQFRCARAWASVFSKKSFFCISGPTVERYRP